ncbi:MAG: TerC/Alx family metal homeostasis membrane protein [Sphingobacteriaceae bacterium]|nr:MAG: TerC/Alx family metal homeostasis membrane protein [Pedobacter sp.]
MPNEYLFFLGFLLFIALMLAIDLGVFNKRDRAIGFKEAAMMSAIWVLFALGFYFLLLKKGQLLHGIESEEQLVQVVQKNLHQIDLIPNKFAQNIITYRETLALEFLTGYIIEYALSVDNIFVIVLIFSAFCVEKQYYHRVLFWGILGAVLMRFLFIFIGATLIAKFAWILYVFGVFLIYTGIMIVVNRNTDAQMDPNNHQIVKWASKYFAVFPGFVGNKFFVKMGGKTLITSLFLVLLIVELTDLIFAVDSIPAIFVVTKDPYIVFFSNIFAILGLRSMFFLLINVIHKFHYLKFGLAVLLVFIGMKMLMHHWLELLGFTTIHSLMVVVAILACSVMASLIFPVKAR